MAIKHDTKYYTIPKGRLLWKPDAKAGYEDLGNVSKVEITEELEFIEHFRSRGGLQERDFYAIKSVKANGAFTFDSLHHENLMKYFLATDKTTTDQVEDTATEVTVSAVQKNRWHEIGAFNLSNLIVKNSAGTITYEEDVDYELDLAAGQVYILEDGAIANDDDIKVTYDNEALTIQEYLASSAKSIKGHMFFVADSPFGELNDLKAYGMLTPDGAIPLISEEIATMSMKLEIIKHNDYKPGLMKVRYRGNVTAETI